MKRRPVQIPKLLVDVADLIKGEALDLTRIALITVSDDKFGHFERKFKEACTEHCRRLIEALCDYGLVKPCDCLLRVKMLQLNREGMEETQFKKTLKKLKDQYAKNACDTCGGIGYVNVINIIPETASSEESPDGANEQNT